MKFLKIVCMYFSYFGALCCGAFLAVMIECNCIDLTLAGGASLGVILATLGKIAENRFATLLREKYETELKLNLEDEFEFVE